MKTAYIKYRSCLSLIIMAACIVCLFGPIKTSAENGVGNMIEYKNYFGKLLGTRPDWPDNMTAEEEKVMQEHYYYLLDHTKKKKILMAGPVFGDVFGLVVLKTADEAEARNILDNDPSVKAELHTYELQEMRVSLMSHNVPSFRYAGNVTDKVIHKEVIVPGNLDQVWNIWTTGEGLQSFFSPNSEVDLRIGGKFEIFFLNDAPYGDRGSEDCLILSYLPRKMLSFEWNAPPSLGEYRYIKTHVVILFSEPEPGKVKVDFSHYGWGEGEKWQEVYDYFDRAWGYVLGNFEKRMNEGPLDWSE